MEERGILRAVDWRSLFPWLLLVRTFKPATATVALLITTVTLAVWPLGWQLSHLLFLSETQLETNYELAESVALLETWRPKASVGMSLSVAQGDLASLAEYLFRRVGSEVSFAFEKATAPFFRLAAVGTLTETAYLVFGLLWSLLIWSFCGGFLARAAVAELGCEQREDALDSLKLTISRFASLVAAPLFPLIGVFVLAAVIALGGFFMGIPADIFPLIGAVLWGFALLLAVGITFFLLGLIFGWPLMVPAAMSETIDAFDPFDPVSRAYSYTTQKPLQYLFFVVVATAMGLLGFVVVIGFSEATIAIASGVTEWSLGSERFTTIQAAASDESESGLVMATSSILSFWIGLVRLVAHAFLYSFFWTAAGGVYLLLRQVTDQTEVDEIYFADEAETYALPPIDVDDPAQLAAVQGAAVNKTPEKIPAAKTDTKDASSSEATGGDISPSATDKPTNDGSE